ncbi:hypothetical protein CROQUDRAFT_708292 [Cronartium quercuum f. sp. fusiforme G11]|uniref:Uncharacterized protein n=1 Tax=Cronartium quercuum f. sp. fusiforme G11 TaxID=708437 RepID=A0A9P6NIJ1_9BASI|nr:hypothetical protein CROQUDRAFT_708292 [Cronartium quercuum f. sp. fusiforme G11]
MKLKMVSWCQAHGFILELKGNISKLTAQPKDSSMMMMLAEDFQKMACLEAPHTTNTPSDADMDTHSDSQDTVGSSDVSFVDFVCNF